MKGYLLLIRPLNLLIAFIAVLISLFILDEPVLNVHSIFLFLSIFFIGAGANSFNDYVDREIDRLAHPKRPIARGLVGERDALIFSITLLLLGVFSGIPNGFFAFIFALSVAILSLLYNIYLKRLPFIGNFVVSFITGCVFLYSGLVFGKVKPMVFPFFFALAFNLGRELVKDMEDAEHDLLKGLKTLPILLGGRIASRIAIAILLFLVIITFLPYFLHYYSLFYFITVLLLVDVPVFYVILTLMRGELEREVLKRLSVLMKIDMIFALLSIFVGGVR